MREIVAEAHVGDTYQYEVALKYGVKVSLLSWIMRNVRKNPDLLDEIESMEIDKAMKKKKVVSAVDEIIQGGGSIWNIAQVREKACIPGAGPISDAYISRILRTELHMKYKRVKKLAWKGNDDRCLVLR